MKSFIVLLFSSMLFLSGSLVFAQKIVVKGGETRELKECVSKYCTVMILQTGVSSTTMVSIDEGYYYYFAVNNGPEKMKFQSLTQLFNFMDQSGWRYADKVEDPLTAKFVYLFEKK